MLTRKGMRLLPTTWLTDGVGQDTAWKYFSNPASGYQSYSRVPANMPFATRRLNRMHRHCLENSGRESDTSAGNFLLYILIGARWLGHCVAGAE